MKVTHRFPKSRLTYTHYNKAFIAHNLEEYRLISAYCLINQYEEKIRLADDTAYYIIVETPKYESLHPLYRILKFDNKHELDDSQQETEKYIDRLAPVYYIGDDYELNFSYDIISLPERVI